MLFKIEEGDTLLQLEVNSDRQCNMEQSATSDDMDDKGKSKLLVVFMFVQAI